MRDESDDTGLKKAGRDQESIEIAHIRLTNGSANLRKQSELLKQLEDLNLLNPFYRAVLQGIHNTGIAMTEWQPVWTEQILNNVNKTLSDEFDGDFPKSVSEFLSRQGLIDNGHGGKPGDRYSMLVREGDHWIFESIL